MLIHLKCFNGHVWRVTRWSPGAMRCPTCGQENTGRSSEEISLIDHQAKADGKAESLREQAQADLERRAQIALRH